ncbi:MAG TPA: tRNA (adenosine(37)-N6)-dimethylallyltransferase MiaA [Ruminococcaceae bacterium]|nr:tRNA (adenosine(37)-N6)-dimethylallyltransferase MiaA [Oscillospiraceae bacterium]
MDLNKKIFIPVICGPTASGKTDLGVRLALRCGGEIVSADSMQIYKGMDIASAKPSKEEMQGVAHHLMSFLPATQAFSVADYVELAHSAIKDIRNRGRLPIVVGGTGLYISSLINNIKFDDTGCDYEFREEMRKLALEKGNDVLWEKLRQVDQKAAEKLHPNNLNRIIRALEVYKISGSTITEAQEKSRLSESPYSPCFIMPDYPRQALYQRIDKRVDIMLERGLLEEAREFFTHKDYVTAAQAIGYKELKPFLDGEKELLECVDRLKQVTRNYAKRQLTWFNKEKRLNRLDMEKGLDEKAFEKIVNCIKEENPITLV